MGQIFSVLRSFMGFACQFLVYFVVSYNTPLLSLHVNEVGLSPNFMAISLACTSLCFALCMPVEQKLTNYLPKRGILVMGLAIQTIGAYLLGVEGIYHWYNPGLFIMIGSCFFGFGMALITLPVMPEILEAIEEKKFDK